MMILFVLNVTKVFCYKEINVCYSVKIQIVKFVINKILKYVHSVIKCTYLIIIIFA